MSGVVINADFLTELSLIKRVKETVAPQSSYHTKPIGILEVRRGIFPENSVLNEGNSLHQLLMNVLLRCQYEIMTYQR